MTVEISFFLLSLSIEWNSIKLGDPAHGTVTKAVHKSHRSRGGKGGWGGGGGGENEAESEISFLLNIPQRHPANDTFCHPWDLSIILK